MERGVWAPLACILRGQNSCPGNAWRTVDDQHGGPRRQAPTWVTALPDDYRRSDRRLNEDSPPDLRATKPVPAVAGPPAHTTTETTEIAMIYPLIDDVHAVGLDELKTRRHWDATRAERLWGDVTSIEATGVSSAHPRVRSPWRSGHLPSWRQGSPGSC